MGACFPRLAPKHKAMSVRQFWLSQWETAINLEIGDSTTVKRQYPISPHNKHQPHPECLQTEEPCYTMSGDVNRFRACKVTDTHS